MTTNIEPNGVIAPALAPTPTAEIIAKIQGLDVAAVEAALLRVREAQKVRDPTFVQNALVDQAMLLQALGEKLLKLAGNAEKLASIQTFANLGFRAMDLSRKALTSLVSQPRNPPS
jgi:hypothetical protein